VLNPDKRPHILPDQFVKERLDQLHRKPAGATCCLERGAYSTAACFSVNRFFVSRFGARCAKTTVRCHASGPRMNSKAIKFNLLPPTHSACP